MGLYNKGEAAAWMMYDSSRATKVWLGGALVWEDLTVRILMPPTATATAAMEAPTFAGAALLNAATATATASMETPHGLVITLPVTTGTASAAMEVPSWAGGLALPAVAATGAASMETPIFTTGWIAETGTATATAEAPAWAGGLGLPAETATASASAPVPTWTAGLTMPAVTATASAAMETPSITIITFNPSGMTKNGTQDFNTNNAWVLLTSWNADTSTYPGSSVSANRLVVQGSKSNATLTANVPFSGGALGNRQHTVRIVDQSNNVLATGSTITGNSGTCTATATNVDLTSITSVGIQIMSNNDSSSGSVSAGASTYLTIT